MLRAWLESEDHTSAWRMYMAEQLWMLNAAALRGNFDFPHYIELIDVDRAEKQRQSDARELEQVRNWLLGGDSE